jgi:hypothetical protein
VTMQSLILRVGGKLMNGVTIQIVLKVLLEGSTHIADFPQLRTADYCICVEVVVGHGFQT